MKLFTGKQYTQIALANAYGKDRETWDKRLQWVMDNHDKLDKLAPEAKETFQYVKAFGAYQQALRGEPTGFLMGLDATASGIQSMACLTGCEETGRAVNLINTGNREDVYDLVARKMGWERDDVKKPLMVHYYGSEAVPEKTFGTDVDSFYDALDGLLPGAEDCMELFQSLWNPTALEYSWVMPDKHVVVFKVLEVEDKKVEVDELDHATFTYRTQVNKPKSFGLAMAANATHSVDSYICREMIRRCKFPMLPIHDCFFAHPNDMNHVRRIYTEVLSDICQMDLLKDMVRQIAGRSMPVPKKKSDLHRLVLQSEYALS